MMGFAISQPLYQVLSESPTFFVAHGANSGDIWLLSGFLLIGGPTVLLAIESISGAVSRFTGTMIRIISTLLLSTLFFCLLTRGIASGNSAILSIGLAATGAGLLTYLYETRLGVRDALALCGLAVPVLTVVFLTSPGVRQIAITGLLVQPNQEINVTRDSSSKLPSVVMIVFDEFGTTSLLDPDTREIDARRFPNFARLAARSTFFRHATAVSPWTATAVPAILTGRWPTGDELPPVFESYPQNLLAMLAPHYESLNVHEGLTRLCPDDVCSVMQPPFWDRAAALMSDLVIVYGHIVSPTTLRDLLPSVDHKWAGFASNNKTDLGKMRYSVDASDESNAPKAIDFLAIATSQMHGDRAAILNRFLNALPEAGESSMNFIHILLPHQPWVYLPSGRRYGGFRMHGAIRPSRWAEVPDQVALSYQRYLLQIGFVDTFIGELMRTMETAGTWDDALVIVTADHGANIRPGQPFRPLTAESLDKIMPIPLFIKFPHQRKPRLDLRAIQVIDLAPTVFDAIGLDAGIEFDGHSLLDPDYTGRNPLLAFPNRQRDTVMEIEPEAVTAFEFLETKRNLFAGVQNHWPFALAAPHDELVGRRVDDVGSAAELPSRAEIDQLASLQRGDPNALYVPALVSATIEPVDAMELPYLVAISINGVIQGVTRTTTELGDRGTPLSSKPRMLIVLPETAFTPGPNDISLWLIDTSFDEPILRRIPLIGEPITWRRRDEMLVRHDESWAIKPRTVVGSLDRISRPDPTGPIILSGWAIDVAQRIPVAEVAAFKKHQMIGSSIPSVLRKGVEERYGATARGAGFTLVVPADVLGEFEAEDITVFGLTADGQAGPLSNRPAAGL